MHSLLLFYYPIFLPYLLYLELSLATQLVNVHTTVPTTFGDTSIYFSTVHATLVFLKPRFSTYGPNLKLLSGKTVDVFNITRSNLYTANKFNDFYSHVVEISYTNGVHNSCKFGCARGPFVKLKIHITPLLGENRPS